MTPRLKPLVVRWKVVRGRVWWQHRHAPDWGWLSARRRDG